MQPSPVSDADHSFKDRVSTNKQNEICVVCPDARDRFPSQNYSRTGRLASHTLMDIGDTAMTRSRRTIHDRFGFYAKSTVAAHSFIIVGLQVMKLHFILGEPQERGRMLVEDRLLQD